MLQAIFIFHKSFLSLEMLICAFFILVLYEDQKPMALWFPREMLHFAEVIDSQLQFLFSLVKHLIFIDTFYKVVSLGI